MKYTMPVMVLALLTACGDGKKEAAERTGAATEAPAGYVVDLAPQDLPLTVDLGDLGTLGADSVEVAWNDEFGWLTVKAGERFSITISEEPGDMARLKADLERDNLLQTHTVLEETPELLVYRSQFPDEDLVFIHFYRIIQVGGRSFVVEEAVNGRFNEADIKRMAASVQAKAAA
jgi:hypothetical protein